MKVLLAAIHSERDLASRAGKDSAPTLISQVSPVAPHSFSLRHLKEAAVPTLPCS